MIDFFTGLDALEVALIGLHLIKIRKTREKKYEISNLLVKIFLKYLQQSELIQNSELLKKYQ